MSWEKTDEWPDGRTEGGAFRAAAEVIVAGREAPTLRDRIRLWWYSTPDHPFGAIARRVVLTPSWLYCETRAGGRRRVHVAHVRGSRREAGRVIYAIADGDDLVIADRGGDALERALDEEVGTTGEWRSPSAFAAVFFFSQRYVADSLGLTSVRGLFGWVRSTVPIERISAVIVDRYTTRNNKSRTAYTYHFVDLVLRDPLSTKRVFSAEGATGAEEISAKREIARRVATLHDVELRDRMD